MKILVDMNLSPRWVDILNAVGFQAVHWSKLGSPHAKDFEIMNYAAMHKHVVLTHDLDFGSILAVTHGKKPSVVQIRAENINPDVIAKYMISALNQMQSYLEAGALLTIEVTKNRLRLLPLQIEKDR